MDTDGSVFVEKHFYNGKVYAYKVLTLTNYSQLIIQQSQKILDELGFNYNISNNKRLNIRYKKQIKKYFQEIETNNLKHLRKILN